MEQKIQVKHPAGKKAVSMDKTKYDALKKSILNRLKTSGESTHTEILHTISEEFKKNNIKFEGSIGLLDDNKNVFDSLKAGLMGMY